MADFRDLETRGVPEHLWPDDAFQQKYTQDYMMGLTDNNSMAESEMAKGKKDDKVPVRLEFEQRYILDTRRSEELMNELLDPQVPRLSASLARPREGNQIARIRQFYDKGDRYRHQGETWDHMQVVAPAEYLIEKKRSLYLNTSYSANSEEETATDAYSFERGWKTSDRRLQKIRFQVPSVIEGHRTVVDFFYTDLFTDRGRYTYAITAEDEVILDDDVRVVDLHFRLPLYLGKYMIREVDSRDPEMKTFRSANMIDTNESIEAFERAFRQLYERT